MGREAQLDVVVGALYEAAVEPEAWTGALTAVADLLDAVGAQFFLWDKQAGAAPFAAVGRLPEEGNAAYVRYYGAARRLTLSCIDRQKRHHLPPAQRAAVVARMLSRCGGPAREIRRRR
jgi:hypothetical protein